VRGTTGEGKWYNTAKKGRDNLQVSSVHFKKKPRWVEERVQAGDKKRIAAKGNNVHAQRANTKGEFVNGTKLLER